MTDIKHIDIAEFRREGYLQELNRRFLHPLGLALEVVIEEDGLRLGGVWDYRDDPEGIVYAGSYARDLGRHAAHIDALWIERAPAREAALGYVIQPVAGTDE